MSACPEVPSCALPTDTILAANIAVTTATNAANKKMRLTMPPSFILASLLALPLPIGSRPLETSPRVRVPQGARRYIRNNTGGFGAQDEPYLGTRNVVLGAGVPDIPWQLAC